MTTSGAAGTTNLLALPGLGLGLDTVDRGAGTGVGVVPVLVTPGGSLILTSAMTSVPPCPAVLPGDGLSHMELVSVESRLCMWHSLLLNLGWVV